MTDAAERLRGYLRRLGSNELIPGLNEALAQARAAGAAAERERVDTGLDRGPWLHYTTHQVACPVGPWIQHPDADCTCGYTLLVDQALAAEYARLTSSPTAEES